MIIEFVANSFNWTSNMHNCAVCQMFNGIYCFLFKDDCWFEYRKGKGWRLQRIRNRQDVGQKKKNTATVGALNQHFKIYILPRQRMPNPSNHNATGTR